MRPTGLPALSSQTPENVRCFSEPGGFLGSWQLPQRRPHGLSAHGASVAALSQVQEKETSRKADLEPQPTSTAFSAARSCSGGRRVRAATAVLRNAGCSVTYAAALSYNRARRTTCGEELCSATRDTVGVQTFTTVLAASGNGPV